MTNRYSPATLSLGTAGKVRCASNRRYAVVQLVTNHTKTHSGNYRPKVMFRSDSAHSIAVKVRQLGGWSWVFDLKTGDKLWENASSEWMSAESAILNTQGV